ncbi:MAG TPA: hypothetical protein VMZ28_03405 [Kofleriaceae bacterium]|nr:hypothetical protein [Kofleriaceae bacterium]
MLRDDYLIRLIKQVAAFVARVAGLRRAGQYEEALQESCRAFDELFDLPHDIGDAVDTPSLASILRTPEKMRLAAQLYWEEGRIYQGKRDPLTAALKFRRAFELYLEARAIEPTEEDTSAILELSRLVPASELAPRYREHT